jgi:hypothetical protein
MNGNMVYLVSSRGCCAQSHKRCYKSNPRSIPEFQPGNGEILEGLTTVCKLILRHLPKNFIIQPTSAANVTYCNITVEFYKYFLQMV